MPKISIIIAMYNIEKYIAYCINSCILQKNTSVEDYEIVIINDGSTDHSLTMAEKVIQGISNARIITRPNGGLSAARNTGIENAKGQYLWFVDGDDAISDIAISTLLHRINMTNSDAYLINFSTFGIKDKIDTSHFSGIDNLISGKEYHFTHNMILPMMAWLTIYKAEVLKTNNIFFMPGILHEDMEFSIRAHHISKSIEFVSEDLYLYRIARTDSIMRGVKKDNTRSLVSNIKIIKSFKIFFCGVDNTFVRRLYGMLATSFFIRKYDSAFILNETTSQLLKEYKISLYKYMWQSRQYKRRMLLIFMILMPSCIISKVLYQIGNRSKLL